MTTDPHSSFSTPNQCKALPYGAKKAFSLIELAVVVAVLAILVSLLMPSLNKSLRAAKSLTCMNNLKDLGAATSHHMDDNDDRLPPESYNINTNSGAQPPAGLEEHHLGRRVWYSELNLGIYLFLDEEPPSDDGGSFSWDSDYANHKAYNCPSGKYSDATEYPMSYWVNTENITYLSNKTISSHRRLWADNWTAYRYNNSGHYEEFTTTSIHEIHNPSELISMMDCAQDSDGKNNRGAAGLLRAPRYTDLTGLTDPVPSGKYFSPLFPASQNLVDSESTHNSYDFRHDLSINVVFVDGHVSQELNGALPVAYVRGE